MMYTAPEISKILFTCNCEADVIKTTMAIRLIMNDEKDFTLLTKTRQLSLRRIQQLTFKK